MIVHIAEELNALKRDDGLLIPEDVVEFAQDPNTASHNYFTWDDTQAAHEHRLNQARQLIRMVLVYEPQTERNIRTWVSLTRDRVCPKGGYRAQLDVLSHGDTRQELRYQAMQEFIRIKNKYAFLTELIDVFDAVDTAQRKYGRARPHRRGPVIRRDTPVPPSMQPESSP